MFQSSLKEAQAFQNFYLPNAGSYYRDNRNYSYDFTSQQMFSEAINYSDDRNSSYLDLLINNYENKD